MGLLAKILAAIKNPLIKVHDVLRIWVVHDFVLITIAKWLQNISSIVLHHDGDMSWYFLAMLLITILYIGGISWVSL